MKAIPSLFFCLFFLISHEAVAQWKFSGSAGPYLNALMIPSTTIAPAQKAGLVTDFKLENKFSQNWRIRSDIFIRTDFIARDSVETFQWNPKNLYLQKKLNSFTFRFGYQTLSIDGPDVVNPADVVHSKNWIDPTSPITYSSAGISASQEINQWNWEIFYVPYQTKPVLPGEHSPWLPREKRLPIESENLEIRIPDNAEYKYLSATELNDSLKNNVTFKLQNKSERLETQFIYYNGLSQVPYLLTQIDNATLISFSPKQIIQIDSPVALRPLYYRQQVYAGTFILPFSSWAIRGGVNWTNPTHQSDIRVPSETTTGVLGVEKNVETGLGIITGIAQYIRQKRLDNSQISFLRSIFEEAISAGLRIPVGEETSFLLGGLYDFKGRSSLYRLGGTHRLSNSWSVEGSAQFLQGPEETLVGLYQKYDSYQLKALYFW